jgi:hypothetical protein
MTGELRFLKIRNFSRQKVFSLLFSAFQRGERRGPKKIRWRYRLGAQENY